MLQSIVSRAHNTRSHVMRSEVCATHIHMDATEDLRERCCLALLNFVGPVFEGVQEMKLFARMEEPERRP